MSTQSIVGLIIISVGAIVSLIGFFIISPINDFVISTLLTALGFVLIVIGGRIIKTRLGKWVNQ